MNVYPAQQDWVKDCCEIDRIPDMERERAVGISHIHATCSPPCPRVTAALEFLRIHGGTEADVERG